MDAAGTSRRLEVGEKLTFGQLSGFRAAFQPMIDDPSVREIVVDLRKTAYIDSAALGMLLLLKQTAEPKGKKIAIDNATGTVRDILEIAHFGDVFDLR